MALPIEINAQRIEGDTYPFEITVDHDLSDYALTMTVRDDATDISPSIVTATAITFPGTVLGTLATGLHQYKITTGTPTRTLVWGIIQIYADNIPG